MKNQLLLGAAAVALTYGASAAVQTAVAQDWSGFYAGVHAGYAANDVNLDQDDTDDGDSSAVAAVTDTGGGLGGIHAGYNWERNRIVYGVEGDVDWLGVDIFNTVGSDSSEAFEGDIDFIWSLRARLGYDVDGETLAYVTGGVAYIDSTQTLHAGSSISDQEPIEHNWGGVLGAGVAHKISPHLSLRAEAMYYLFGDSDWVCQQSDGGEGECEGAGDAGTGDDIGDLDLDVYTFRIGATVHF